MNQSFNGQNSEGASGLMDHDDCAVTVVSQSQPSRDDHNDVPLELLAHSQNKYRLYMQYMP